VGRAPEKTRFLIFGEVYHIEETGNKTIEALVACIGGMTTGYSAFDEFSDIGIDQSLFLVNDPV
jgi:hypothetical protein